jgi:hypothetical protein
MSCMRACGRLSLTHRKYTSTFMLPEIGCKMQKKRKCDTIHVHHVAAICSCLNVSYAKMCFMCVCTCVQAALRLAKQQCWLVGRGGRYTGKRCFQRGLTEAQMSARFQLFLGAASPGLQLSSSSMLYAGFVEVCPLRVSDLYTSFFSICGLHVHAIMFNHVKL